MWMLRSVTRIGHARGDVTYGDIEKQTGSVNLLKTRFALSACRENSGRTAAWLSSVWKR
jgi:hypothetical protein